MNQHFTSFSLPKKLGLLITALAVLSFFALCFVIFRLISLGYPLSTYLTSQGTVAPSYLFDAVFALNGLCGTFLIFEGILLLLEKKHTAQVFLPFSFILIILPYIIAIFPYSSNIGILVANIFFFPAMIFGIILLIMAARILYGKKAQP